MSQEEAWMKADAQMTGLLRGLFGDFVPPAIVAGNQTVYRTYKEGNRSERLLTFIFSFSPDGDDFGPAAFDIRHAPTNWLGRGLTPLEAVREALLAGVLVQEGGKPAWRPK